MKPINENRTQVFIKINADPNVSELVPKGIINLFCRKGAQKNISNLIYYSDPHEYPAKVKERLTTEKKFYDEMISVSSVIKKSPKSVQNWEGPVGSSIWLNDDSKNGVDTACSH